MITDRPVYQRRRLLPRPVVGLLFLTALALIAFVTFSGISRTLLAPGGTTVRAVFANTGLLSPGSPVREQGVDVGTVDALTLDAGGRSTTVKMTISDKSGLPLHANATAQVAWRTVLGANYAVNLDPGTATSGPLTSGLISERETSGQVEVDQILATLQQSQRRGLRTTLDQLPAAIGAKRTLANAANTLAAGSPSLTAGLKAVQGEHSGDLIRLVDNTTKLMSVLQEPEPDVKDLVSAGGATLSTTAARQADIQQTISLASGTLPQIELTARQLNDTLALANPVLNKLNPVVSQVKPTVAALNPTVSDANVLLGEARPLLSSLRPTAAALRSAAGKANPLLADLTPSINQTATEILPDLAKVYKPSGRATYEMIGPTLADLDAIAASVDGTSHMVSLTPGAGDHFVDTLPCQANLDDPTAQQLVQCESLTSTLSGLLGELSLSSTSTSDSSARR